MGSKRDLHQAKKPEISLFGGDDGFCIRTFLAREPSLNQLSDLYCRESEGIPFKWETRPGTPRRYPHQDILISSPPLTPSPLMQSLELRPPNHDQIKGSTLKSSKVESFKKMVQRNISFSRDKVQKESLRFGELMESVKDSSVSSSSSSSFSFPWKDRRLDSSRGSMFDSGSCCRNGNIAGILLQDDEENKGVSATHRDEMQPPPAVHSSCLPPPRPHSGGEKHRDSAWTRKASFWIKGSRGRRKTENFDQEISFRCPENMESRDYVEEFDDSIRRHRSNSCPSCESKGNFEALAKKRAGYFSCGSWKGVKRDSSVCSEQI